MKAPFEKFEVCTGTFRGGYVVDTNTDPDTLRETEAQRKLIETAIRKELARIANTQEGKP